MARYVTDAEMQTVSDEMEAKAREIAKLKRDLVFWFVSTWFWAGLWFIMWLRS